MTKRPDRRSSPFFHDRFDPQGRAVGCDLDRTRAQAELIAKGLRDKQPPCLVNG
jgi:hypothetical protein